jgi:hypothetical protein
MRSSCRATTSAYVVGSVDMHGRGSYSETFANGIAAIPTERRTPPLASIAG